MLLQLKITLLDIYPEIWRRVIVDSERPLEDLHWLIQIAFGWKNAHLYCFRQKGKTFELMDDDVFVESDFIEIKVPESIDDYTIGDLLSRKRQKLLYMYDYGDSWEHEVVVESSKAEPVVHEPFLIDGARQGPPEDCGGFPGYMMLLEALAGKSSPRHEELMEWVGEDFDPEEFDPAMVNMELRENFED